MSVKVFKTNMRSYMETPIEGETYQDFSAKLTKEYDNLIRRGGQIINNVSVDKTNTNSMENILNNELNIALHNNNKNYDIINKFGNGIIMYWTGTTLNKFPTPIIPAKGAFKNQSTTNAIVLHPGKFPNMGSQPPINNVDSFLDVFILAIQIHLSTISGIYNTISLYPGFPIVSPAPGILEWTGYSIP